MLTWEESLEAQALRRRGWTIAAIARHLDRDPKTIRAYLSGERTPGVRRSSAADPFALFAPYVTQRLTDDPHLWATTLYDEVVELGYAGSYQSFTRAVRTGGLRPACEECAAATSRDRAIIAHPPGEETQWDWVELPDPPPGWGLSGDAHLLVGALAHSSRWRGVLAESEDQPHLIEALDRVVRRLGGTTLAWRFDRMATVCHPGSGEVTASFAEVAKHYQVAVRVCPPRRGRRKGVVEKSNHAAAQRWWRTLADDVTVGQAQADLDALCARVGDARPRRVDGVRTTVGALADAEPLQPPPGAPYPAVLETAPTVTDQALVPFLGNFYSVPPGLAGRVMRVRARLGDPYLEVVSAAGAILARHRRQPDGAGVVLRDDGHVAALEAVVLAGANATAGRCKHKTRRPLTEAALAEAAVLRGEPASAAGGQVVVDLAQYASALGQRGTASTSTSAATTTGPPVTSQPGHRNPSQKPSQETR
ncbi:MAG TPA: IS21 family transposase [Actinomycetota bacterium]|nr:IS21 family transposase [Actinomycetota bacterium]